MAFAVLVSLAHTIEKLLHDYDQYSISLHEKQHIISIHEYVIFLQAFLEDFPEKANSLEGQIRDVAYEAEDNIEDLILEHIPQHRSVTCTCLKRKKTRHHFDFQKLEKVTREIDSIARQAMEIKNSVRLSDDSCVATSSSARHITAPASKDIAMVGFEDDLLAIKGRLCGESSKLEVIPIYGMGGIGKTTLARNAFVDQLIVERFDIRAWVTVSQDFRAPRILSSLPGSVGEERSEDGGESRMVENVHKTLKGRRYLIVLDDLWDTKVWDDVRRVLPDDHNGSRVVLTTRLWDVATYPKSCTPLHEMHFMDPDQSWNLLRQKVFKEEHCPRELENIGREIARRCRGLPLAIVVIAGLLSSVEASKAQPHWKKIARNVNEIVTQNDEQFADTVLSLSYNHLPQHLKPCFLYMGIFPEDYEIRVSRLIKLYVAEGLSKLPNVSKTCEETAEEYLEDLVKRSLVSVNMRKYNGKIKSCNLHDMVRNLCIRKAEEEKFILQLRELGDFNILTESRKHPRCLSIQCSIPAKRYVLACVTNRDVLDSMPVRTVLHFEHHGGIDLSFILKSFRLLRVLDALDVRFRWFPVKVLELFHLRYLAFSYGQRCTINVPSSILKLQNLQTLFICPYHKHGEHFSEFGRYRIRFPSEIWRMSQLRHILVSYLEHLPSGHALENLQTLAEVTNLKCTEGMVQMFPNLKKLGILYEGKCGENWQLYELHNLAHMHQLEVLKVKVDPPVSVFWENLAFPRMLRKLVLRGFHFRQQDLATVGLLPNLQVLKLLFCSFVNRKWQTSEGEFRRLKCLKISYATLQHWITESSHFPMLEHLWLIYCHHLDEIPDGIGEISTLELIEVNKGNKSLVESAKSIQEEQRSFGNDAFQVHVLRWRFINGRRQWR